MPWLSIISFLITFFFSKSKGASTAEAAALGAVAGLGAYYLADPANPDNLLGIGSDAKTTPGSTTASSNAIGTIGDVAKTGISTVGSTLQSWGPTGTLGVVAGTTALSSVSKNWLPWIGGGLVLLLLLR